MRAVVFAYHNVGVRCLKVLLARGVDVALVVTHQDNPSETIWFESVAALCREKGIRFVTPDDPKSAELFKQVQAVQPDFIFSFYYRHMLPVELLALAKHGAYNMHGSLLPKYRGRVPVNWAVLHGETETGATLHEMAAKPDAGAIVAQASVPILPDDTAYEVFGKVTVAAEQALWNALPAMLAGQTPKLPNDLSKGSYFGGRKPEDGRIDWSQPAQAVYNLHRAVAPPYPGAWTTLGDRTFIIVKARLADQAKPDLQQGLAVVDNCIFGVCGDGRALLIHELMADGKTVSPQELQQFLSSRS
ncbi:formyltransferase [Noviherbaspirillum autotrophicum]|uniref:Formyltransferase n=1 Tax=Noviherbaspirillum autotrophicum TaxID=709839 RepID=A0A0C2BRQ0_9BURK|nr:formyltransferase [Noviherbaspirillum autotrophicum]KIF80746.1 formyltransferase [Noviherbaspirillum autotrophicum]